GLAGMLTRSAVRARVSQIELVLVVLLYAAGLAVRLGLFVKNGPGGVSAQWLPANLDLFALGMGLAIVSVAGAGARESAAARLHAALDRLEALPALAWGAAVLLFALVCDIGLPTGFAVGNRPQEMARQILYGLVALLLVL